MIHADANASLVYSGVINLTIPSNVDGLYLNVVSGAFGSSPASAAGWDVNLWGASSLSAFSPTNPFPDGGGAYVGSEAFYDNIPVFLGYLAGPNSTFSDTGIANTNPATPLQFNSSTNGIGFRFINEANGNQVHYGFLRFGLSSTAFSQPRVIVDYLYESTPGREVVIFPATPTASVWMGFAAVISVRRRR